METIQNIEKFLQLPESENYSLLREKGIEYIREMGIDLWTDHNVHDPGITILEILCYAITELGYKTNFAIQDIIADDSTYSNKGLNDFYSAREILTNSPVTLNDFRKIIIDVRGVKNAWLTLADDISPKIYADCENSILSLFPAENSQEVKLSGLYNVVIELDDHPQLGDLNVYRYSLPWIVNSDKFSLTVNIYIPWDVYYSQKLPVDELASMVFDNARYDSGSSAFLLNVEFEFTSGVKITHTASVTIVKETYGPESVPAINLVQDYLNSIRDKISVSNINSKLSAALQIVKEVEKVLQSVRPLCEDYYKFSEANITEVSLCADLIVSTNADAEEIYAQIIYKVSSFLSPYIGFYTLKDMIAKGYGTEDIFQGPALTHGFIDETELGDSEKVKTIHYSDIVQIIMSVKGVEAVKNLMLSNFIKGIIQPYAMEWSLTINEGTAARIDINRTKIVFYKGQVPFKADKKEVAKRAKELLEIARNNKLEKGIYDIDIKPGNKRDIQYYSSIQNDFPLNYAVGPEGFPPSADDSQKAKAKQLKAFLLFCDKLLADYLSQLSHVRDIFSTDPSIRKTYFPHHLFDIPDTYRVTDLTVEALRYEGFSNTIIEAVSAQTGNLFKSADDLTDVIETSLGYSLNSFQKKTLLDYSIIPGSTAPGIPRLQNLIKEFVDEKNLVADNYDIDKFSSYETLWNDYSNDKITELTNDALNFETEYENEKAYYKRKNRIVDHLIARFAEDFTDFSILVYSLKIGYSNESLIKEKLNFLNNYPELSSQRGKAYNYKYYNPLSLAVNDNLSGLQKRCAKLLGIENVSKRSLVDNMLNCFKIFYNLHGDRTFEFQLVDEKDTIILVSESTCAACSDAVYFAKEVERLGIDEQYFTIAKNADNKYLIKLIDENGNAIAHGATLFDNENDANSEKDKIRQFIIAHSVYEGFHLVEHILLRPTTGNTESFAYYSFEDDIIYFEIYNENDDDDIIEYRFRLVDDKGQILLSSSTHYLSKAEAFAEIYEVIKYGQTKSNYTIGIASDGRFYINLINDNGEVIARRIEYFKTKNGAEEALDKIVDFLINGEDFSKKTKDASTLQSNELLPVCLEPGCNNCPGEFDPYSFRATVVIPYWLPRFKDMNFRRFFEITLRKEAPAHVHLKVCWIDQNNMRSFEKAYLPWLKEMANESPDIARLEKLKKELINILSSLRNVYPESIHLYDCSNITSENPVVLDYSVLAQTSRTSRKNENDKL